MKRYVSILGILIIITMHCSSFYPAKAAITAVDYGEMLNTYLGAAETALAASQGVTIDWSNLELPAGSDTWTDHQKAEYVVSYIGNLKKVGEHAIYEWLFGESNDTQDVISANTAAIGLAKNTNIDTQDIKAQLDNILATQSNSHVFQRYTDKVIARWNEYDTNYINDYLAQMNVSDESSIVTPPADASQTIQDSANLINGTGFDFLRNLNQIAITAHYTDTTLNFPNPILPYSDYTFYHYNKLNTNSNWTKSMFTDITTGLFISQYGIDNIYITSNNGVYSCTLNKTNSDTEIINGEGFWYSNEPHFGVNMSYGTITKYFGNFNLSQNAIYYGNCNPFYNANYAWSRVTISGTLNEVFEKLSCLVRNANIYVDGVLYSQAGTNITSGLTISLPNAVIDSGTDDGKIVAHPIYYPDAMNTDKAIDIDLDKVVDAIASRIAQGADDITFDDLVDAGAAVKLDGTTLTDADTVVKDVSVPIARAKVDTINGVVPTIDVVPPLPPLPPLNPGDYSGEGFSGMSVLARIINATVQSLPAPIILTFFGVVFGAVILGIIKILHK